MFSFHYTLFIVAADFPKLQCVRETLNKERERDREREREREIEREIKREEKGRKRVRKKERERGKKEKGENKPNRDTLGVGEILETPNVHSQMQKQVIIHFFQNVFIRWNDYSC